MVIQLRQRHTVEPVTKLLLPARDNPVYHVLIFEVPLLYLPQPRWPGQPYRVAVNVARGALLPSVDPLVRTKPVIPLSTVFVTGHLDLGVGSRARGVYQFAGIGGLL